MQSKIDECLHNCRSGFLQHASIGTRCIFIVKGLSVSPSLVGIELLKTHATYYNFSRQKLLKPVLLLGHYGYLRIRCYIHEAQMIFFCFSLQTGEMTS